MPPTRSLTIALFVMANSAAAFMNPCSNAGATRTHVAPQTSNFGARTYVAPQTSKTAITASKGKDSKTGDRKMTLSLDNYYLGEQAMIEPTKEKTVSNNFSLLGRTNAYVFHEPLGYEQFIQTRIDVSRPYYILENERAVMCTETRNPLGFFCTAEREMPLGREGGEFSTAEAGRHMAIAGSIAAALRQTNEGKFYYLALDCRVTRRVYQGVADGVQEGSSAITARCTELTKRTATCEILMKTSKDTFARHLTVTYVVLSERAFKRMYPPTGGIASFGKPIDSPYANFRGSPTPTMLKNLSKQSTTFRAALPTPHASQCSGHFNDNPALPVAFFTAYLIDITGQSIAMMSGTNIPFKLNGEEEPHHQEHFVLHTINFEIQASKLIFTDSHGLDIKCNISVLAGSVYHAELIAAKADQSGEVITQVEATYFLTTHDNIRL